MSTASEPGSCKECGWRGRYQRYGYWFCEQHIGLAEQYRDRHDLDPQEEL